MPRRLIRLSLVAVIASIIWPGLASSSKEVRRDGWPSDTSQVFRPHGGRSGRYLWPRVGLGQVPRAEPSPGEPRESIASRAARGAGPCRARSEPVADPNLWGANGNVLGMARSGNTLYIAGSFRSVGENSGGFVPVDAKTGEVLKPFPKVAGVVGAIVPDGSGGWYIGGEFTAVGGKPRSCLAQVRADGSVTDWNPSVTGSPGYIDPPAVGPIAVLGDRVFVGGAFREIGGLPRENMGCVDARTGAVLAWNPGTHVDGFVSALVVQGTTVFVGGAFSSLGQQAHAHLGAVDGMTGAVLPWQVDATGNVSALLVHGDTLFVAGEFQGIAGALHPLLAAIDIPSARLLPFDAHASGIYLQYVPTQVAAMTLAGDTLYVAGNFTQIGGQPRMSVAALNAATGDAFAWAPDSIGPSYEGFPPRLCTALAVRPGVVYVGGFFETFGGQSHPFVAALNTSSGAASNWNPKLNDATYALGVKGDTVYVGGSFTSVGEWRHRAGLAAIDLVTGAVKAWNPNPDGGICTAVAVHGNRVFVSGDFANIGGQPQPRSYFAALDTITGETTDWNPGANSLADTFLLEGDTLYVGGEFTQIGGQPRGYLAAVNAGTGEVLPWDPNAGWPVYAMARNGNTIYVGGIFQQMGGETRRGLAAIDAASGALTQWNPDTDNGIVEALLLSGNTVYAGGQFGVIGGQPRRSIAALDATTGSATPWYPQPTAWGSPTEIKALALAGGTLYVGGAFGTIGGQPRICLASVDTSTAHATDWDPGADGLVWSLAAAGGTVYVGGGFTRVGRLPAVGLAAFSLPAASPPATVPFALAQSIPNPARFSTTIRFALPEAAPVTLSVFDLQGRRVVAPLDHVFLEAGSHDVPVQVSQWAPGVYLYRLETGHSSATRKLAVIR